MTAPTRPEPVLNWAGVIANWQRITAAVVGLVYAVGAVLVAFGLATDVNIHGWAVATGTLLAGVGTVLSVVMPLVGAHHTMAGAAALREQVTPLESPQNSDGVALIAAPWHGQHEAPQSASPED